MITDYIKIIQFFKDTDKHNDDRTYYFRHLITQLPIIPHVPNWNFKSNKYKHLTVSGMLQINTSSLVFHVRREDI